MSTKQERVVEVLTEGFGPENVDGIIPPELIGGSYKVKVWPHGEFLVDQYGVVTFPEGIPGELAYLIDLDLRSLNILMQEENK